MDWAKAPLPREQLVMFPKRLDEAVGPEHVVRLLDDIFDRIDWSRWEAVYDLTCGQPPIHPRVLAGVILYGLLTRIRSSRALEDALRVRIDFQWLAEGRSIDHTTLSEFRRKHAEPLKDLFVQIGLIARQLGWLTLETLAFDGTRLRANNRRSGTRTPERLREMQAELAARYAELEQKIKAADAAEEELFGDASPAQLKGELADVEQRRKKVDAAMAELDQMEQQSQKLPKRLPITDPQSRVTPGKDGGFAPHYTPLATVDVDSGLIVSVDVIPHTDEDKHLLAAIDDVQQSFSLEQPPADVLADGMMATGANLAGCEERQVTLYSPLPKEVVDNPAVRDDPTQPVAVEDRVRLPLIESKQGQPPQLDKQAFVYDAQEDCYWCPEGKRVPFVHTTSEKRSNGERHTRYRYKADPADCGACPLRSLCLKGNAKQRQINREEHEGLLIRQRERMRTEEAQQKYSRRCSAGERPFAVIKQQFGARQFLMRGLERVKQEWRWLTTAFNVKCLLGRWSIRASPSAQLLLDRGG